jgi:hypothetical protein
VYFAIVLAALLIPRTTWFSAVGVVLAYFFSAIALMLQPAKYAELLQLVGYGGEIPIVLETKDDTLQERLRHGVRILLVLQTNDTFIVRDESPRPL